MKAQDLKIGMIVYHKDVYNYREPLEIISLTQNEIEVEGDVSGGTHAIKQRSWLPIDGTSLIYNYGNKIEFRNRAKEALRIANDTAWKKDDLWSGRIYDLIEMVLHLTEDAYLNSEQI